jgi:hypothetical protein
LAESPAPAPTPSPQPYNRLSAIRRPPKLDIDAVRRAEERGSMTSLPDLIRRATRLATMIDHGKRPGSRFDNLNDFFDEKGQMRGGDKENSGEIVRVRNAIFLLTYSRLIGYAGSIPSPRAANRPSEPRLLVSYNILASCTWPRTG